MKFSIPALFCLTLLFAACGNSQQTTRSGTKKPTPVVAKDARATITGATLSRGACFGRCPVYTVQVWQNGLVRYTGQQNTPMKGVYEKNVGAEKVNRLFANMKNYRIDTMQADYPVRVSDLPSMTLTVTYANQKEQEIQHANLGPEILYHIGESIDSLARIDFSWTKIVAEPASNRN